MRILFLNQYAGTFGGVEVYIQRTARALADRGMTCLLGRLEDRGDAMTEYLAPFAEAYTAPDAAGLAALAARLAPDVVFLHKLAGTSHFLPLRNNMRLVRYVHDHDICCPRRHKYYAWGGAICQRRASLFCLLDAGFITRRGGSISLQSPCSFFDELAANRQLDLLLVASRFMRDELVMNGCDPRRVVILPPVPPEPPVPPGSPVILESPGLQEPPVPPGSPQPPSAGLSQEITQQPESADPPLSSTSPALILYVGQLIRGKGVDTLLAAFAQLRTTRPGLRLAIAGRGNAEADLQALATRLELGNAVSFEGHIQDSRLDQLYRSATLLAVPSRWPEPFGMVGLEAMRRGLPVAASAVGGIPDWLEDGVTGYLAAPNDPRSLATAMTRILDDRTAALRLGRAGQQRAERDFAFTCSMDRLKLYLAGEVP
jgi:glycosyltransferase involved in cell wall biosynthesis